MTTLTYRTKPYPHQVRALKFLLHNRGGGLQVPAWLGRREAVIRDNGCWDAIGPRTEKGYCLFWDGVRQRRAHRAVYEIVHDVSLPPHVLVLHTCDNPPCVRPTHLLAGSAKTNSEEMVQRGRHRPSYCRGEFHGKSKLTSKSVVAIRKEHTEGFSIDLLAAAYNVNRSTIHKVIARETWTHV
jgi:hypothetical protein